MNLLLKVNFCFIFLLCLINLKGQTNFRPGFVITNENDTLRGLIDYRGDIRNSQSCDFKDNETSVVKEFKPFDIKGYRFIDSKFYVSKTVMSNGQEVKLFIEYLVNGIAGLYYYFDSGKSHYFIEKADGRMFELTNDEVLHSENGQQYLRESKSYIGYLRYAFADCPQIYSSIDQTQLETKSLIKITKKYHDYVCKDGKCIIYEKPLPAIRIGFASFVSMNVSSIKFSNCPLYEAISFNTAYYPSIGLQMNMSLPRVNEKLTLQISEEYGKSYYYGTGTNPFAHSDNFEEVYINFATLKGKAGIKYTYPKNKIRPIIMAGGIFSWLPNKNVRRVYDSQTNSTIYMSEYRDDVLPDSQFGYYIDLGVDYHFSKSIVSYFSVGYNSVSGGNEEESSRNLLANPYQPLKTKINTINITAGIYF
jgi:hypothetical protein